MKNFLIKLMPKPLTATILLAMLLFCGNSFRVTEAQVTSGGFPYPFLGDTTQEDNPLCEPEMKKFAALEAADFRQFMEKNFENKSSTSSLLELAIAKYRAMRKELYQGYNSYFPKFGSAQDITATEPGGCMKIVSDTLADARVLLKQHAVSTSGVKKSTALLEKYKSINDQLSNLYQQFVFMRAYLDTFSAKLPCYVKSQCMKG